MSNYRFLLLVSAIVLPGLLVLMPGFLPDLAVHRAGLGIGIAFISVVLIVTTAMIIQMRRRIFDLKDEMTREEQVYVEALKQHTIFTVTKPDTTIIDVNDKFLEVFGYSRDEVIGRSNVMIYPDGPGDARHREVNLVVNEGKSWSGEFFQRTKSGEILSMLCTVVPLFDHAGRHVKNVSLRTDVTQERRAAAQKRLTSILEGLPDQVYVLRASDLSILYLNSASRKWCFSRLGWTEETYRHKGLNSLESVFSLGGLRAKVMGLLDGDAKSVVHEVQNGDDAVEINVQLIRGAFPEDCFVAVVRDISVRREIEAAKREIVSVVSHELRTPLTSIRGSLGLASSGVLGDITDRTQSVLKIAERNCDRMLMVVNDMLDLEKIQAGKMDFSLNELDLTALLHSSAEENEGFAAQFGVTLRVIAPPYPVRARGNADRLAQVMTNLLSNAVKFSPEKGEVRISLERHGDSWRIGVSDDGPGIAPEDQARIFDRFAQARPIDGVDRKGSGLGLHIVRKIVERHGGEISLTSGVGKGSCFCVDLPGADETWSNLRDAAE